MHDDPTLIDDGHRSRVRRLRWAALAAALISISLPLAACGGGSPASSPGVAGSDSPSKTSTQAGSGGSQKKSALAFSKCMRAHGIVDFPDPNSNGQIQLGLKPGSKDLTPDSPRFQEAQQACGSLMPGPSASEQRAQYAQTLEFAKCMRAHGVSNFPDPQPPSANGAPQVQSQKGPSEQGSMPDPNSSQFQSAQESCKQYQPGGTSFNSGSGGS
jgi:hypothetical protein